MAFLQYLKEFSLTQFIIHLLLMMLLEPSEGLVRFLEITRRKASQDSFSLVGATLVNQIALVHNLHPLRERFGQGGSIYNTLLTTLTLEKQVRGGASGPGQA
jgi:hypothetical protein